MSTNFDEGKINLGLPFAPVTAIEEKIQAKEIQNGNLYFATDSGRIYLDMSNERISFGGHGVSILYASGTASDIKEDLTDFTYYMNVEFLDDNNAEPKKEDLIINKDGRFFKILAFNETTGSIHMSLIAVSGTGGGGTGDSGGTTATITLKSTGVTPNAQIYIYGQKQEVEFTSTAENDAVVTLTYIITSVATKESRSFPFSVYAGQPHKFDLGSNLYKGLNTLRVNVTSSNSGSTSLSYENINSITLALKESNQFNPLSFAKDGNLTFRCIPVGEVNKTLKVYLNNDLAASATYNATISD